jgi:hypothetical protein
MHSATFVFARDDPLALVADHVTIAEAVRRTNRDSAVKPRRLLILTIAKLGPSFQVHLYSSLDSRSEL